MGQRPGLSHVAPLGRAVAAVRAANGGSIGQRVNALEQSIGNQAAHQGRVTFQEEYRRHLEKYGLNYDERCGWE
jgi:hypothetical protein